MDSIEPEKLPFLSHIPTDERQVFLLPIFEPPKNWRLFFQKSPRELIEVHPIDGVSMLYLAKQPRGKPYDMYMPLANTLVPVHPEAGGAVGP
jgi:hypothetical protein